MDGWRRRSRDRGGDGEEEDEEDWAGRKHFLKWVIMKGTIQVSEDASCKSEIPEE